MEIKLILKIRVKNIKKKMAADGHLTMTPTPNSTAVIAICVNSKKKSEQMVNWDSKC